MSERRYRAFITHSHADAASARWLHRALERYRLPRSVAAAHGLPQRPLFPVFLDRHELATAGDLAATLRDALSASEKLIVLCSPEARESPWVAREIAEFVELRGLDSVFCCITAGDPPGVFPAALLELLGVDHEPLAADLRPSGDGRRSGVLKLVAGLVGIGYDELQRRDAHRRHRRLALVAAGATAGMLLTSWLAVSAVLARNAAQMAQEEAETRRTQAEDLIGFMLGDLRSKLEQLGRLDLLEDVGDKATHYFGSVSDRQMSDRERVRLAQAMHQIGEVRFRGGDFPGAVQAFEQSLRQAQEMAQVRPQDNERLFELSQAHYWVGFAAWYEGSLQRAQQHWLKYFEQASRLREREPDRREWLIEFGYAHTNLGALAKERGAWDETRRYFEGAAAVFADLAQRTGDPEMLYEHSSSLSWLGSLARSRGLLAEAVAQYAEEADILTALVSEHDNAHWRYSLAMAQRHLGELAIDRGQLAEARERLARGAAEIAALLAAEPRDTQWRFGANMVRARQARVELYAGDLAAVRGLLDAAVPDLDAMLAINPDNGRWQVLALDLQLVRAAAALARGQPAAAHELAAHVLERGATVDGDQGAGPRIRAEALLVQAMAAVRPAARQAAARRALEALGGVVQDTLNPDLVVPNLRAHQLAGSGGAEMLQMRTRVVALGLAHPALADDSAAHVAPSIRVGEFDAP